MTLSISVGSSWKLQIDAVARSFFLYTDLLRLYIHKNGFCQVELLDRMKDFNIFFFGSLMSQCTSPYYIPLYSHMISIGWWQLLDHLDQPSQ